MNKELEEKYDRLLDYLRGFNSVAVAYSSGVDSTFLLRTAVEALGVEHVIAVTAHSSSFPSWEYQESMDFCEKLKVRHFIVEFDEMGVEGFQENPKNRCYLCKKALFGQILKLAREQGIEAVLEGSNLDDNGDYRPGMIAISELKIKSPLRVSCFSKEEIREASKELGLPTWKKPSFACLASRFPYGEKITKEKLSMVEKSERYLMDKGFEQFRVRIHDKLARIEVMAKDIERFLNPEFRCEVNSVFREIGFTYVALDLQGFRSGSMNETLSEEELNAAKNIETVQ